MLTALTALVSLPLYPFDPTFALLRELAARSGQALPAPPAVIVGAQLLFALTLAGPPNALFAFGEEFGWRGYLLPASCGSWARGRACWRTEPSGASGTRP